MQQKTLHSLMLAGLLGLGAVQLSGCVPIVAAGVGTGVMMAEDRRTSGTYLLDEEIELKTASRVREAVPDAHVNVTSYNRRVLLTGEVANDAARDRAREIAKGVPNVAEVQNELIIGGVTTFGSRSNDAYLTVRVKARLFDDKRFNANHIKVITEAGTTFLMGLVKRDEAAAAAEIAAKTGGVTKVVKVFEYMD